MTISTQDTKVEYTANGVQTAFDFDFKVMQSSEMKVYFNDVVQPSGYSVSGLGSGDGGTVTFGAAPTIGTVLELRRITAKTQDLILREHQKFPAESLEKGLDKIIAITQELQAVDADIHEELDSLQDQIVSLPLGANYTGETPPAVAVNGKRWYKPSEATTYVYYCDGDSCQWVQEPVQSAEGTLRDELAIQSSTVLVGGSQAQYLNRPYTVDDYTVINPDVRRLAANAMSLSQTLQTVITGDSLSFNGYGYADFAVVGSGYATDQPFGMSSWSHLIRDLLFTANSAFTGLQDLRVKTTASVIYATTPEMFKNLGINAKAAFYNFTDTGKNLKVQSNYSTTAYLVVSYAPASDAVYFVVDGTEYDNETPIGENLGYGYLLVPTGTTETTITNVRKKTGGGSGGFWLYGIAAQNTKTVKITGKGGYTSGQILSEYASLVGAYIPDVIYYIIGANDIDAGVPLATFSSNIESFISNARAAKSDCTIILISSVPSSAPSLSRSNTKPYIKAMRDIARDTESSLIDLYSKLETIPSTYWQFDSIHFNKQGDNLVFNIIKDLTLSQVPIEDDKFVPARESYLGAAGAWLRSRFLEVQEVPICFLIKFEAGTPIIIDGLSSNAAFTASLTLSYVADGSFDKSRIVCPPTHMISGAQIVNTGADLTERVVPRFITNGQNFDFARVNSSGQQTIAGSNLFALVNFVPLSS